MKHIKPTNIVILIALISACNYTALCQVYNKAEETKQLNKLMDAWHQAAAVADEDTYFGLIDSAGVFLGTDETERWQKQAFMDWGMKRFTTSDTAWAYTSYNRNWDFSRDGTIAWFDELLKTHMGVCRGSGVLEKHNGAWKIKQYNLAVAVPNSKMKDYRKLVGVKPKIIKQ